MTRPQAAVLALLDDDSFAPISGTPIAGDPGAATEAAAAPEGAAVAGWGTVDGADVLVCALGSDDAGDALARVQDLALRAGRPLVTLLHGGAATSTTTPAPTSAIDGRALRRAARLHGVVPQVTVVLGPVIGPAAWLVAMADVVVAVEAAGSPLASPPAALATSSGALLTPDGHLAPGQGLDPAAVHAWADDTGDALDIARDVLWYLPASNQLAPERREPPDADSDPARPGLADLLPAEPHVGYDVRTLLDALVDDVIELQPHHGRGVVAALAHVDGRSVAIVANNPETDAGHLDAASAAKAARVVRLADAFNLPVVTLVDCPGLRSTLAEERDGLARRTAALVGAYASASVPLLTVLTRRGAGDAALALGSRALGADAVVAWEGAAVDGDIDAVIPPDATRAWLTATLRRLERKRDALPVTKHGGGPW